ncbi:MAG TPA: hypothetical protein VGN65_01235 [Casimicrobiaceae bacterium]|jgi:hypothetical protein
MSRSNLPQSDADRIAAAATVVAIATIVWVVLAVSPDPRDVSMAAAHAMTARHVDEGSRAAPRDRVATLPKASAAAPAPSRGML